MRRGRRPDRRACRGPLPSLAVRGPLDVSLTGVLASLATTLADAHVPIFVVSTFDTDLVLVPADRVEAAEVALTDAGHRVHGA